MARYDEEDRLARARWITLREAVGGCGADAIPCLEGALGRIPHGRVVWTVRAYDVVTPRVQRWLDESLPVTTVRKFRGVVVERRIRAVPAT
jgi:hypothetical protein